MLWRKTVCWKMVQSLRKSVFMAEANMLNCLQASGIYHWDPSANPLKHMFVAECALHFSRNDLPYKEMMGHENHMSVRDVVRALTELESVVSDMTPIFVDKVVYRNDLTKNGWRQILWSENKSAALMKALCGSSPNLMICWRTRLRGCTLKRECASRRVSIEDS